MKRLRPKTAFLEAAERITMRLGSFNAVHLRRGDFVTNELSKRGTSRSNSVSGQEIVGNLASRMSPDDPPLICTDGSPREEIFYPIRKYFCEVIFLDSYLSDDAAARAIVAELPIDNEASRALLTN
jgi:hypothetical protein